MTETVNQYNLNKHLLLDWDIPDPSADLILWHEGYKAATNSTSKLFNDQEWEKYTDSIINFANHNDFKAVGISIVFADDNSTLPVNGVDWINKFIAKAEPNFKIGIDIGYQSGKKPINDTKKFQAMAETLSEIKSKEPLIIGLDGEQKVVADNALEFTNKFKTALTDAGVKIDEFVILSQMKPKANWEGNLLNGFEFYSQKKKGTQKKSLNHLYNQYANKPIKAFQEFNDLVESGQTIAKASDLPGPGTAPVFAISRSDDNCLGGKLASESKLNKCGITDIFGQWRWDKFEDFLGLYTAHYPTTDKIFIFQGEQLPCDWLTEAPKCAC